MIKNISEKPTTEKRSTAKTSAQSAYDYVKSKVMTLGYKPGQFISDKEIAQDLGISRTPVREGLKRLEQEGILINTAGRGWKVYALSLHDIDEIFEIKDRLEGLITREASECQDKELKERLHSELERMKKAAASKDFKSWQQSDIEIHEIIFQMCPNNRACEVIRNLNDQWYRIRIGLVALGNRIERSTDEHEQIVTSILSGNGDLAERQMKIHLGKLREELIGVVEFVSNFVSNGV